MDIIFLLFFYSPHTLLCTFTINNFTINKGNPNQIKMVRRCEYSNKKHMTKKGILSKMEHLFNCLLRIWKHFFVWFAMHFVLMIWMGFGNDLFYIVVISSSLDWSRRRCAIDWPWTLMGIEPTFSQNWLLQISRFNSVPT